MYFKLSNKHTRAFIRYNSFKKLFNFLYLEIHKLFTLPHVCAYPYTLTVDVTNICNLKCPFCPTGRGELGRDKRMLSLSDFTKIIDEFKDYLYIVNLFNWGEPLLNKDIFEMIRYAHKNRIFTSISTNLNFFNEEIAEKILNSDLDYLIVSIDGVSKNYYEKYRIGGDFDKVVSNLKYLINKKKDSGKNLPLIVWRYLTFDYNAADVNKAKFIARELKVDKIDFEKGSLDIQTATQEQLALNSKPKRCSWLWHNIVINSDGGVSPCCLAFYKKDDLGNIFEEPFINIWNNVKFINSRKIFNRKFNRNKDTTNTICSRCMEFGLFRYSWIK